MDPDMQLALQLSMEGAEGTAGEAGLGDILHSPEPPPVPPENHTEGFIVRRVVAADNSCLFNCVGYTLFNRDLSLSRKLRRVVAYVIGSDTRKYNAAILEKTPSEYQAWIMLEKSWGGSIECGIFSDYFKVEIGVFDTQTVRLDVYGEGKGYTQRIYFIYDGVHYDPLAYTFDTGLPEDCDVTVFNPRDPFVQERGLMITAEAHKKREFTDTSKYSLRCLVCGSGLAGNDEAVKHATRTGHTNFSQIE